jgi:hypothetical protein
MGIISKIKFSELNKTTNLIASSRVQYYWERMQIQPNNRPLNYYLSIDNDFTVGQLKTTDYYERSKTNFIPIIDQGKDCIAGYTDNEDLVYKGNLPVIIFGDHTRIFKFIDFPFVQGADGIKILYPDESKVEPLFFYYLLRYIDVPSRGYNRHFSLLSVQRYLYFDLEKQKRIISKISPLEKEAKELERSKLQPVNIINKIFGEVFDFDWIEFENIKQERTYNSSVQSFANNIDCRMGIRFHNKAGQYVQKFLEQITNKRIKDFISESIFLGKSVSPKDYDEEGEYFYIAMSNIKTWAFNSEDCKKVSDEYSYKNLNKTVQKGDILLARSGEGTIGKVALIEDEEISGIFSDFTQRIRLTGFDPLCAYYYFRSDFFQYLVYTHKKGLGNNTNIFPSQIKEFPMPDWDEKQQAEIVEAIKTQLDEQKEIDRQIEEKQQAINNIIDEAIKVEQANA